MAGQKKGRGGTARATAEHRTAFQGLTGRERGRFRQQAGRRGVSAEGLFAGSEAGQRITQRQARRASAAARKSVGGARKAAGAAKRR